MTELDVDIVIVGSGAAGGTLAATLAEHTDARVLLLEKGGYFTKESFNQREWDMTRMLYAGEGTRSTFDGGLPVRGGECVGGGTTVNIALSFDPVRRVWEGWRDDLGLEGFSFDAEADDYGASGLNMAGCLASVRERLGIFTPSDEEINANNRSFERGCTAMGVSSRRFELNMRGCIGCGFCAVGCAYDAKQGTLVTYIPDALERGVQLVHHCDVQEVTFSRDGSRAVGLRARVSPTRAGSRPNTVSPGELKVNAKLVILAAGAIASPMILARSRLPDPHGLLGRGLVLHPSLPFAGFMPSDIIGQRGIEGSYYSDHFVESHGFYLECMFGHPVYGAALLPGFGSAHYEMLVNYRRIAGFGVMLIDTVNQNNRVEWSRLDRKTHIHYAIGEEDSQRLRFAAERAVEIMFAAGAREVVIPAEGPLGPLPSARLTSADQARYCEALSFEPHRTVLTSAHPQATMKMSARPSEGMLNARGETHAVQNLIVCDASSFPASCGANPMISIITMARYQGMRVAHEWSRYES